MFHSYGMRQRLDSLNECARRGYRVKITCGNPTCGRVVTTDPVVLMEKCHRRRIPMDLDKVAQRLKCGWCLQACASVAPIDPMADPAMKSSVR